MESNGSGLYCQKHEVWAGYPLQKGGTRGEEEDMGSVKLHQERTHDEEKEKKLNFFYSQHSCRVCK